MINLSISIYCPPDGKNMNIASDLLKREDHNELEVKIVNIIEKHLFDLIKSSPQFVLKDSRAIHEETADLLFKKEPAG